MVPLGLVWAAACQVVSEAPAPARDPAPAGLRRLSQAQLNNALGDAFDPTSAASSLASELPQLPELRLEGFAGRAEVAEPTDAWVDAAWQRATLLSEQIEENLEAVTGCPGRADARCLEDAVVRLAARLWRRPLTAEEEAIARADHQTWTSEFGAAAATSLSLQVILQAPQFLYAPEFGQGEPDARGARRLTGLEVANRLALLLYDGLPDDALLAAAPDLHDPDVLRREVLRMIASDRGMRGLADFADQWLETTTIGEVSTDLTLIYPDEPITEALIEQFHRELQSELRAEPLFLFAHLVRDGAGTLSELLTTPTTWTTPGLATWYTDAAPESTVPWRYVLQTGTGHLVDMDLGPVQHDPARRAGLLTTLGVLHARSKATHASPVQRGLLVRERLLCEPRVAPPGDIPPLPEPDPEAPAPLTNRDRFEAHVSDPSCASCHDRIDGAGFTFEHYDLLGRWRDSDAGVPVDARGALPGTSIEGPYDDAIDLVHALASSREVHDCFVSWWYRHALARGLREGDTPTLQDLQQRFWDSGGHIPGLLVDLVQQDVFLRTGAP